MTFDDLTISADDVEDFYLAGEGQWWWHPDSGLVVVTDTPLPDGAMYLMPWDETWFAQWAGDWVAAAELLHSLLMSARGESPHA